MSKFICFTEKMGKSHSTFFANAREFLHPQAFPVLLVFLVVPGSVSHQIPVARDRSENKRSPIYEGGLMTLSVLTGCFLMFGS